MVGVREIAADCNPLNPIPGSISDKVIVTFEFVDEILKYDFQVRAIEGYIYLIRCFSVKYRLKFLRVVLYFDEPAGRVKKQVTSKNIRRYSTLKHL